MVLVVTTTPRPLFLQNAGVPHISFPPYTRKEAIKILIPASPDQIVTSSAMLDGLSVGQVSILYPQFVATVYDSLVGPTAGTIPQFRSICERLWPKFVAPILKHEKPPGGFGLASTTSEWDFARLLVRNRGLFRMQGEDMLVHRITTEDDGIDQQANLANEAPKTKEGLPSTSTQKHKPNNPAPSLPYFPTLVLTSAYIASYTPSRLDTVFFSKFSSSSLSARNKRAHHRRRLKLLSQARPGTAPAVDVTRTNDLDNTESSTTLKKTKRSNGSVSKPPNETKRSITKITKSLLSSAFASSAAATSASSLASGYGTSLSSGPPGSTILTAKPFTLERLLAIYRAIDPNPVVIAGKAADGGAGNSAPAIADAVYTELATLRRLRLVVPSSLSSGISSGGSGGMGNLSADLGEKWCINVSGDWIGGMAQEIGVEVGEWLAGGLD